MKRPIKPLVIIGDSYEAPLEKYADHLEAVNKKLKKLLASVGRSITKNEK